MQRVVFAVGLSLFLASRAEAAFIQLDFAVTLFGPQDASFSYAFFESSPKDPPYGFSGKEKILANGSGTITAGVTHFLLSLDVTDLSSLYFAGWGSVDRFPNRSLFAASPPGGFDPGFAFAFGPPWVSLANVRSQGLSERLVTFNGPPRPDGSFTEGTYELTEVPEPASILLLGTGLTMLVRRRLTKRRSSTS